MPGLVLFADVATSQTNFYSANNAGNNPRLVITETGGATPAGLLTVEELFDPLSFELAESPR